jgi:hypothetical protein
VGRRFRLLTKWREVFGISARGLISVTERHSYTLLVRELAKACGEAWLATEIHSEVGRRACAPPRRLGRKSAPNFSSPRSMVDWSRYECFPHGRWPTRPARRLVA